MATKACPDLQSNVSQDVASLGKVVSGTTNRDAIQIVPPEEIVKDDYLNTAAQ